MPPDVDVYLRLDERNERTVRLFLDTYMKNWHEGGAWLDAEPVEDALDRAFSDPGAAFARYGRSSEPALSFVILAFGRDGSMVLGLSLDGEDEPETEDRAERQATALLDQLLSDFGGSMGMVAWEEPPPLDLAEWEFTLQALEGRLVASRP